MPLRKKGRDSAKKRTTAENREGYSKSARVMAIIMIAIMLVFTFITAGIFLLD